MDLTSYFCQLLSIYAGFPHICEQIFDQMDKKCLQKCREVTKSWQECIDEMNLLRIHFISVPKILKYGNTYLHVAAKNGHSNIFKILFKTDKIQNPENHKGTTSFQLACQYGQFEIVKLFIQKPTELNIDLNAEVKNPANNKGTTQVHLACQYGLFDTLRLLIQKSTELNIDLNPKHNQGKDGK